MIPKSGQNPEIDAPAIAEAVRFSRRTRWNPMGNLSAASLTRALDGFERGDLREAAMLWDAIARRDDTIPSVKAKREKSVAHKPLETVALEKSDAAEAHRETLTDFWKNVRYENAWDRNDRGGIQKLIRSMQSAVSFQYAPHHIIWRPTRDGLRATFEYVPLWFFEAREARLRFLPSGYGIEGAELDGRNWMVSYGDGLMFAASIGYFLKRASLQDWLRFSEKFAMPGVLGKTSAAKGTPEGEAMRSAVESFGNEWAAVLYGHDGSASAGLELIQANGNPSAMPMPALIERVDKKIAAMYRGADLSTMSSGSGAEGTGASLQGEEQDILERADAADRSEELQAIERTVIAWTYGEGTEPLAQTRLIVPEREDQKLLLEATKTLVDMGARLPMQTILARFGLSEADADEAALAPKAQSSVEELPAAAPRVEPADLEKVPGANAAKDVPEIPLDQLADLLMQSAVEGFEDALGDDDETEGNTATTDAIWKDGETSGGDRLPAAVTVANAAAITEGDDGWYQIAPYGEFPTNDGKYLQVFGPDQARAMVKHFNSLPFKITRWLLNKEIPVFIGHPDIDRKAWSDERKLAVKHTALEVRGDGLWGRAEWNSLGRDNLANGFWQYPSPVWLFPKPKPGTNRVFPDLLQSVGLTNFQNIPDARRVTHNAASGTTQENEDDTMNPELLAALGLDETATIEQVLEKITAMKQAAEAATGYQEKAETMEGELSTANAALVAAQTDLQTLRTTAANALLDQAIETGAITAGERKGWEARFSTDYEAACNAFRDVKPGAAGLNTKPLDLPNKPAQAPATPGERIQAMNAAVADYAAKHPGVEYDVAVNAVRKDPAMAHLFEAMNPKTGSETAE